MRLQSVAVMLVCLGLTACATGPTRPPPEQDAQTGLILSFIDDRSSLVWPPEPETPRYRYVGQLLGEQNFPPRNQSFGKRLLGWLVGLGSRKHRPLDLQRPQSGLVASDGRILVTDVGRAAVYVFDRHQPTVQIWDMADKRTRFMTPIGIIEGPPGQFLVADADLARVVRLDTAGEALGEMGGGVLKRPTGLARDPATGLIYVADAQDHKIHVFSGQGEWLRSIGQHGEGEGEFNSPTYLTLSSSTLYVTDSLNSRVQLFDTEGRYLRSIGRRGLYIGDLPRPKGVTVDKDGNLYVVESYYDYLLIFNNKGDFLLPIGGTGNAIGRFYLPAGIWSDRDDRIYVADTFNGRIVIFQYLGDS